MKNKLFKKYQTGTVLPPKGAYENRQYFGLPNTMTREEFSQLTPQQIQESIKAFNAKQMEGVKGTIGDPIAIQPYNFQKETIQYSQIPVAKQTFQEAYAAAKNQGLSQFMFEGRPIAVKDDSNYKSPSQQPQTEYKTIQTSNITTIPFKPENMRNQTGGDQSQQIMQVIMQALQQGKKPEEILQALVQSGMDEAQATQIIQQVMQQGQQQAQTGLEPMIAAQVLPMVMGSMGGGSGEKKTNIWDSINQGLENKRLQQEQTYNLQMQNLQRMSQTGGDLASRMGFRFDSMPYYSNGNIIEGDYDIENLTQDHIKDLKSKGYQIEYL